MNFETAFTMETSRIKYGPGVTREVGYDMKGLGARRVMVVTDPRLKDSEPVSVSLQALRKEGIDTVLFDQVQIEPTDVSLHEAIRFASEGTFDGYVAVGGGSSIDTAKAANLYATYPAEFLTYVNAPIGQGAQVPGPVKPLIAIPTTAGTGSETTGVIVFDFLEQRAKTGISHPALRPVLGIVDPQNTNTLPTMVAAFTGLDVLTHALESLTALPFNRRPAPENPKARPPYQGANPISHLWASRAIEMVAHNITRVIEEPGDDEARGQMLLAATYAGIGFGNAGVHLPHAMSYPIAGMVRDFVPEGYPADHPIAPHGMSVVLNAPAVFRFTAPTNPDLHLYAAGLMGIDTSGESRDDAGELLASAIVGVMRVTEVPNGLKAIGFGPDDIDTLVAGAILQKRLIGLSPRQANAEDFKQLFMDSLTCW
jgi:hydroxyacid-oxoacid transhydrogenase